MSVVVYSRAPFIRLSFSLALCACRSHRSKGTLLRTRKALPKATIFVGFGSKNE